ncbi:MULTISPECIES: P1 family peptidase [unclassified Pseudomonas]|uniref:DmpA family aminopeptidase n=1 Tax=unclassified Pseudomonas TaxID=196821 RepID=UPI000BD73FDE|nr:MULTISPECIES: P1 family peptidase [unclassified Pseudomonas]PVZ15531.1 D-aminopeptidase [Pseudomonas sp. URIL14HWK12:I12]PVZ24905.1 D-aminopeptidase [Pseudomonas sp. URIL14HWK12:I10]PVZ34751.1 D-aminopeptidase [Pseudomonas sp. URIL14HWK12:I11]SNZ09167.1 D-aminopeptidase [Pseudomonas sp. URIL14HWK12:I9]
MRARDWGITLGTGQPGPNNAITDVPGVRVGHATLDETGRGKPVRTGVSVIEPRQGPARYDPCFAGCHVLNGNGDATGLEWIREAGLLTTPIATTNTHSVGTVRDALIAHEHATLADPSTYWCMPVVMETYDGVLNDIWGQHVTAELVQAALADAQAGSVAEGAVGGGTGMICHEFKGGIGTASRVLAAEQGGWTVGAFVQANHGQRRELRIDGYPVGRVLGHLASPYAHQDTPGMGSIVVVLATDAPLLPHQCQRLAQRASVGLARTGGGTEDSSGDIFLAFATGNSGLAPADYNRRGLALASDIRMVNNDHISPLFAAAAEAVEEAIANALLAGRDMQTEDGRHVLALDGPRLLEALEQVGWRKGAI